VRRVDDVTVITLPDSVCPPPTERLSVDQLSRMLSKGERRFLLNLKQSWVDAAMIGYLFMLWKKVQQEQGVLKVVVSPATKKTLDTVPRIPFEYFESKEEALASFQPSRE
jgi:hypothetical protein